MNKKNGKQKVLLDDNGDTMHAQSSKEAQSSGL